MTKLKTINEIEKEIEEQKEIIKKNAKAKNYNSWVHSDAINIIGKLQAQLKTTQDIYDEIENIKNPYPEDIFPKLNNLELTRINRMLIKEFKFPLDRLSAELMRRARENLKEELKSKIIGAEQ